MPLVCVCLCCVPNSMEHGQLSTLQLMLKSICTSILVLLAIADACLTIALGKVAAPRSVCTSIDRAIQTSNATVGGKVSLMLTLVHCSCCVVRSYSPSSPSSTPAPLLLLPHTSYSLLFVFLSPSLHLFSLHLLSLPFSSPTPAPLPPSCSTNLHLLHRKVSSVADALTVLE